MKKTVLILYILVSQLSFGQGSKEMRFSFGLNTSNLRPQSIRQVVLPGGEDVVSGFPIYATGGGGINAGLTWAFPISKNGIWKIRTGLHFQTLNFQSDVTLVDSKTSYQVTTDHKLNQFDLPLLLSMEKSKGEFSFGGDFGLIKAIAIWGKVTATSAQTNSSQEVSTFTGKVPASGFVAIKDKYSLYFAPSVRYAISAKIKLEFQPSYRYQFGDKSFHEYTSQVGPPLSQFNINFGIIKSF
jgi:hypothetical protein